jgi:hypothetical protein
MIEISLEEFEKLVKDYFRKRNPCLEDEDIERYLKTDEAKKEIRDAYNSDIKKYKSGEYSYDEFMIGTVSAVANCLTYMYE